MTQWSILPEIGREAKQVDAARKSRLGESRYVITDARLHTVKGSRSNNDPPVEMGHCPPLPEPILHRDGALNRLPLKYGRAISDPTQLTMDDDVSVPKDGLKRRFSLTPHRATVATAANENWRPFPVTNSISQPLDFTLDGDCKGGNKIHPIVAALKSIRRRSADNLIVNVALAQKLAAQVQQCEEEMRDGQMEIRDSAAEHRAQEGSTLPTVNVRTPERQTTVCVKDKLKKRELGCVDVMYVYNCLVDGLAGHVLLDTRCPEVFREGHVRRSVQLHDALDYHGKHFVLISETGELMGREWHAISELDKQQGALSIRYVTGGYAKFSEEYAFLCEDTAVSQDDAIQRLRLFNRRWLPSRINNQLFIAGKEAAEDAETCRSLGITRILSVLEHPLAVNIPAGIVQLPLAIRDEVDQNITDLFEDAYTFISEAVREGHRVLVHCKMGKSRSATLLLMYLMRASKMSLSAALAHLKFCRRQVHVNRGFLQQLEAYEARLQNRSK